MFDTNVVYFLDGELIRGEREKRGWKQEWVARTAGISVRTLSAIERNRRPVKRAVAKRVAGVFKWPLVFVVLEYRGEWPSWMQILDLSSNHRKALVDSLKADMNGDHAEAAATCGRIIDELPSEEVEDRAFLGLQMAIMLDHAGQHEDAIRTIDGVLNDSRIRAKLPDRIVLWGEYHRAIALRRLGRLAEAELIVTSLMRAKYPGMRVAAEHQMGVIRLLEADKATGAARRTFLDQALGHFQTTREQWALKPLDPKKGEGESNHREGFSLARIAQVYIRLGRPLEAVEAFGQAIAVFGRFGLKRYERNTIRDLQEYTLALAA